MSRARISGLRRFSEEFVTVGQFIDVYDPKGYSDEIKRECLEMYVNGIGFRAIERVKKVHHTTVINWVKQVGNSLPDAPEYSEIPEVAELDELETFVG